jgi:hypothetical protein
MAPEETRERDRVDGLLRSAFAEEPVPALPPGFEARLERRLAAEGLAAGGARRPLLPRDRWLLRAYWGLAAAASAGVLKAIDLGPVPWPALAAVALTAAGLALPFLALRRAAGP